jgi:hypothetical protein
MLVHLAPLYFQRMVVVVDVVVFQNGQPQINFFFQSHLSLWTLWLLYVAAFVFGLQSSIGLGGTQEEMKVIFIFVGLGSQGLIGCPLKLSSGDTWTKQPPEGWLSMRSIGIAGAHGHCGCG